MNEKETLQPTGVVSDLNNELGTRPFKVLGAPTGCAKFVRWDALSEQMARTNHGQTLRRLNERGGLGVEEIWANVNKCSVEPFIDIKTAVELVNSISA